MQRSGIALFAVSALALATEPNTATKRWWAHVVALSNDSLKGRDTGSEGYNKAAAYVAAQFEKNGLKPAGEHGYFQTVPLHELRFRSDLSAVEIDRASGPVKLQWLRQISVPARVGVPESLEAGLVFAGSGEAPPDLDLHGKLLVSLGGGGRGAAGAGRGGRGAAPAHAPHPRAPSPSTPSPEPNLRAGPYSMPYR